MNQRKIQFHMIESGELNTAVPQYAGVKGEHNATMVIFVMTTAYTPDVNAVRMIFRGGDGTVLSSDLLTPFTADGHTSVSYALPAVITELGGQVEAWLEFARIDENGSEAVVFRSGAAVLYFEDAVLENGTPFWTGVSQMLKNTVDSVSAAREARNAAQTAAATVTACEADMIAARDAAQIAAVSASETATKAFGYARSAQMAAIAAEAARDAAKTIADNIGTGEGGAGKSAYDIAVEHGFSGDETAWLASLAGENGKTPVKGTDYFTAADKADMIAAVVAALPVGNEVAY